MAIRQRTQSARGAVLVHVAVLLVVLTAFSALAVDLGVSYVSRNQAQTSADAAALAAATSLSFVDAADLDLAKNSALAAAQANDVWGTDPNVVANDIFTVTCPPGAPGVPDTCVRAEVFRTSYGANRSPLPTFFAGLLGINEQGTRGMAVAQMLAGRGTADCVKPWALADRWVEVHNPDDEFNRYVTNGANRGQLLSNPDYYDPTQGWNLDRDRGTRVLLYMGQNPQQAFRPGFFYPVRLDGQGGHDYQFNIENCNTTPINPPMTLDYEPGRMVGPTTHGFEDLIALDPYATWSTTERRPVGGCMETGACARSPRWAAVPVFDVDQFMQGWLATGAPPQGPLTVNIVNVIGVWIDEVRNNGDIYGYITHYPTVNITGNGIGNTPVNQAFARTVILVR